MIDCVAAPSGATADLILVRMALGAKSPTPSVLRKDVGKLLFGREITSEEFVSFRDELVSAGYMTVKGKSIALTQTGRGKALAFAGVEELPPRATWALVKAKLLLPHAAGLSEEAASRLNSRDKLAALLLARKYDLPLSPGATVSQVLEAMVCRELGRPEETSLEGLLRSVLSKYMNADETLTKKDLLTQFPRYETGLSDVKPETIRTALIRRWLTKAEATPHVVREMESPANFDLTMFANTVKTLARTSLPGDRFHDNKVYIAAVWRASQSEHGFPRMTLAEFKNRLLEAGTAGLLTLSRADLVQEMPADLVAESETVYLNAKFHFVLIEGDRP